MTNNCHEFILYRRIAKDNRDNKDQNDTSTTRRLYLVHVLYYTTAIVDYHEIAFFMKLFYTRAATSRHFVKTKSKRSM